jgi:hypothetical protein
MSGGVKSTVVSTNGLNEKIFQKLLKNLLTKPLKCGIIIMSRGGARWHRVPHDAKGSTPYTDEYERPPKKFLKNFSKTS